MNPEWIGWLATALTVASYAFKSPVRLRRIQATSAILWLSYGVFIHSQPVITANVIVAIAALGSSLRNPVGAAPT
jgi:hypothetical protein